MWPSVITIGLKNTLIYTALAFIFGLALGLIIAMMKLSSIGPYRWFANAYVELFRGSARAGRALHGGATAFRTPSPASSSPVTSTAR